jgi:hypothetical protein
MGLKIGIGGRVGPFRAGISTRGVGVGVGPLSAGYGVRRRRSGSGPRNGGAGAVFAVIPGLLLVYLVFAWPYLLGTWSAVQSRAGSHSTARSVVGWLFEVPYLGGLIVAGIAALLRGRPNPKRANHVLAAGVLIALISAFTCGVTGLCAGIFT